MKITKKFFNKKILLINLNKNIDNRGVFIETYNKKDFKSLGISDNFIQDNHSLSKKKYTFRGIHLQLKPFSQSKLVRVIKGSIIDYVVDLRKRSKTFGNYIKIKMDEDQQQVLFIPEGFGHGFLTLQDNTLINYKVNKYYSPSHSKTIIYNDNFMNLNFDYIQTNKLILSKNDKKGITLSDLKKNNFDKLL